MWVQECVHIYILCGVRDVGETEIRTEDDNQEWEMHPRRRIYSREDDFEEGECGVEGMFADIGPPVEVRVKGVKEDCPENNCDKDGEGCYRGVVEVVKGLEGSWETVEEGRSTLACVGGGVDCGDEEVECDTPVAEDCKVGELEVSCTNVVLGKVPGEYED